MFLGVIRTVQVISYRSGSLHCPRPVVSRVLQFLIFFGISSHIQDEDGNFLDCANSKGVDDNCEWNFSISGSTSNPTISINPTSGPVGTLVTVTGNGFDPISTVAITFGGSSVSTVNPTSNGGFTVTFNVPLSSSIGDQTVKATQGSKSASKTFTVTSSSNLTALSSPNLSENMILPDIFA